MKIDPKISAANPVDVAAYKNRVVQRHDLDEELEQLLSRHRATIKVVGAGGVAAQPVAIAFEGQVDA